MATGTRSCAMRQALALARTPGVPLGPNPRVGAVILDADGERRSARVSTAAPGTPHAEVDACAQAGDAPAAAPWSSTLEPCNHIGRTGPCAQALIDAGVRRVVFAQHDPNPAADGGAETLRAAGRRGRGRGARRRGRGDQRAVDVRRPRSSGRSSPGSSPTTLDGRSAAADGTARWITGPDARADVHRLRAECDTVLVGTGTVAGRRPARSPCATSDDRPEPPDRQPLRVVMGTRELDPDRARLRRRPRDDRRAADPRPAARAGGAVRRRAAARLARGRPDARGSVPACRPGRRGGRVRRARPCSAPARTRSATSASRSIDEIRRFELVEATPGRRRRPAHAPAAHPGATPTCPSWRRADVHRDRGRARRGRRARPLAATPSGSPCAGRRSSSDAGHGDSIAVNGCCLTVVDVGRRARSPST